MHIPCKQCGTCTNHTSTIHDALLVAQGILYNWSDGTSGEYVAVLCLSMLLVTFSVGFVSSRGVTDRTLCLVSLLLMMLGSVQLFFGAFPR